MRAVLCVCAALALATPVAAQQVQTYNYDVHGRLVSVSRATSGATQTTTYSLDGADNRSSKVVGTSSSASSLSIASAPSNGADPETASATSGQDEAVVETHLTAGVSNEVTASALPSDTPVVGS